MNPQPDTTTLAGKIAVMQAALEGKKIQEAHLQSALWWDTSQPAWDWVNYRYRVAPEPRYRPWKLDEVRVGAVVMLKDPTYPARFLITGTEAGSVWLGSKCGYTPEELLANWTFLDGSPCGVLEE